MTVKEFAKRHRLHVTGSEHGEYVIPGKTGKSHIYQWSDSEGILAFMLLPTRKSMQWPQLRRKLLPPKFAILQDGDFEGCARFDSRDAEACKLVFKVCRIYPKRRISPENVQKMRAGLSRKGTSPV